MRPRDDITSDRTEGFSLIEVLVAFVILSLVVTACLQVYASSARTEVAARWSEQAHALLRDRLAALDTLKLQAGQQAAGEAADGFRWTLTAAQPSAGGGLVNGRSVIWITASVVDPTGRTYSTSTARWRGEGFTAPAGDAE